MNITLPDSKTSLQLLPERAVLIPQHSALVLSDLHVGKAEHFRRNGIPVPQSTNDADLHRLNDLVNQHHVDVYIVGDLVHSTQNDSWNDLASLVRSWSVRTHLVVGNHDRHVHEFAKEHGIECRTEAVVGDVTLVHDEADLANTDAPSICGHLHPAVRIPLGLGGAVRLPCFHRRGSILTLPAFSEFTGAATITPQKDDGVWIEVEGAVEEVDVELLVGG